MGDKYTLNGHTPVIENDLMAWAQWFETADRMVAKTRIGGREISTVFLGLDHSFGRGRPLLFETMVFGDGADGGEEADRYSTWEEAEMGHQKMVDKIKTEQSL